MTERVKPARQLADARERIVAQMDAAWQRIANLEVETHTLSAQAQAARAEHNALSIALAALGPAPTRARKPRDGAPTGAKPARKLKVAIPAREGVANPGNGAAERTIAAAISGGLLPHIPRAS